MLVCFFPLLLIYSRLLYKLPRLLSLFFLLLLYHFLELLMIHYILVFLHLLILAPIHYSNSILYLLLLLLLLNLNYYSLLFSSLSFIKSLICIAGLLSLSSTSVGFP